MTNLTPRTRQTCKGEHCSPRPSPTQKCEAAFIEKGKQRNEEKTKVLKKEQKSCKRWMRTCKGPKGRTPPGPQHIFARKGKEKSCEEREHRNAPFRQQLVEDTTKRSPIAANCLEKAVKRKPQAEERKTEQKTSPKNPERDRPQA